MQRRGLRRPLIPLVALLGAVGVVAFDLLSEGAPPEHVTPPSRPEVPLTGGAELLVSGSQGSRASRSVSASKTLLGRVEVRDFSGQPAAGATVLFQEYGERVARTLGEADELGALRVDWGGLRGVLRATERGLWSRGEWVDQAPGDHQVLLSLQSGWSATGVVRTTGGVPVSGATVWAYHATESPVGWRAREGPDTWARRSTVTDELGRFEVHGLSSGQAYSFLCTAPGFISAHGDHQAQEADSDLEMVLAPLFGLRVALRNASGGALRLSPNVTVRNRGITVAIADPTRMQHVRGGGGFWKVVAVSRASTSTTSTPMRIAYRLPHLCLFPSTYPATSKQNRCSTLGESTSARRRRRTHFFLSRMPERGARFAFSSRLSRLLPGQKEAASALVWASPSTCGVVRAGVSARLRSPIARRLSPRASQQASIRSGLLRVTSACSHWMGRT